MNATQELFMLQDFGSEKRTETTGEEEEKEQVTGMR